MVANRVDPKNHFWIEFGRLFHFPPSDPSALGRKELHDSRFYYYFRNLMSFLVAIK